MQSIQKICMVECAQCMFLQGAVFAVAISCVGTFAPLSPVCNLHHSWRVLNFFICGNFYVAFLLLAVRPLRLMLEN